MSTVHAPTVEVRIWDPFVRLFHWSLAVCFAGAWLTSDSERQHLLHLLWVLLYQLFLILCNFFLKKILLPFTKTWTGSVQYNRIPNPLHVLLGY